VRLLLAKKLTNLGLNIDNYYIVDHDGMLLKSEAIASDLADRKVFVLGIHTYANVVAAVVVFCSVWCLCGIVVVFLFFLS
jgi:hypothetical protein